MEIRAYCIDKIIRHRHSHGGSILKAHQTVCDCHSLSGLRITNHTLRCVSPKKVITLNKKDYKLNTMQCKIIRSALRMLTPSTIFGTYVTFSYYP